MSLRESTVAAQTILVIDDSLEDRMVFRRFLTRGQDDRYIVLEAESVREGLERCRAVRPDCVVVDYFMNGDTGIDFLDEVAATNLDVAVIMLTGTGNTAVAVQAMKSGAVDYISKTEITADRLRRAVENAIERRQLERELRQQREREQQARIDAERSAERLTIALEAAEQAFYDWDIVSREAVWSDRLPRLFGIPPHAFRGERRELLQRIHPEDRDHVVAALRASLQSGDGFGVEFRTLPPEERWVAASGRALAGDAADKRPLRFTGVVWDITARKRDEAERAEMARRQSRIAETLQRSIMLTPPESAFPGLKLATHYEPASDEAQVGGDFFDVFALNENEVALVVGDVTGKGLTAAASTVEAKFALRAFLRENQSLGVAMERLNRFLLDARRFDQRPQSALVAATIVVLNVVTGEAEAATAGAEPPLILRTPNNEPDAPDVSGALLGALEEAYYETVLFRLQPGDLLALCTDGITEARRPKRGAFFRFEGLAEATRAAVQSDRTLSEQAAAIVAQARDFSGGTLGDDACLLLARYTPSTRS